MKHLTWIAVLMLAAVAPTGCGRGKTSPQVAANSCRRASPKPIPPPGKASRKSLPLAGRGLHPRHRHDGPGGPGQAGGRGAKKAVGTLIRQTRLAVQQNPKLNTPELYKAMSDLILRVHGEN